VPSQNQPATYSIEDLLNTGVQPFPDLPDEDLQEMGRSIGKGPLAIPVSITTDGVLIDGHQRLKAMAAKGRKRIDATDVRVIEGATRENALDWAIRLNAARRHLTAAQKAELARQLQRQRAWSQGRIAKAFGVKRPAVSQWLSNYPAPDDAGPTFVIGEDGKEYPVEERPSDRAPRHPWAPDGHAYRAVHKAVRALQENETIAGLNPIQLAKLGQEIGDLIEAAEGLQNEIGEES
jgi:transcriptional regulator with XRE-family HTH domain